LRLRLLSNAGNQGEVFFTTDAQTRLPQGTGIAFTVPQDGSWHDIALKLESTAPIFGLRVDPGCEVGEASIRGLSLYDATGKLLRRWPATAPTDQE
jgi:arylsulfatase